MRDVTSTWTNDTSPTKVALICHSNPLELSTCKEKTQFFGSFVAKSRSYRTATLRLQPQDVFRSNRARSRRNFIENRKVIVSNLTFFAMDFQVLLAVFLAAIAGINALKQGECEVCIKTIDKFSSKLSEADKKDPKKIEAEFKRYCKNSKSKENRFCYYLGGLEESATGILGEMSKPLSWSMPSDKICEKLKKKDAQICELRYDVEIDLKTVDLKKLKVRDLKKIINDWGEDCQGCIEKSEFIQRVEELKPLHTEL